jgi:hypothetical protein
MRPLKRWERNYIGTDDPKVISDVFRRRHRICGVLFVLALLLNTVLPIICIKVFGVSKESYEAWGLHYTGFLIFVAVPYILFRYRCPRCNAVPGFSQAGTSGVPLFPERCSNCGAPLLPNHRLAQD